MQFVGNQHIGAPQQLAREQWSAAKAAGCAVTYWQQTDDGRWERKA